MPDNTPDLAGLDRDKLEAEIFGATSRAMTDYINGCNHDLARVIWSRSGEDDAFGTVLGTVEDAARWADRLGLPLDETTTRPGFTRYLGHHDALGAVTLCHDAESAARYAAAMASLEEVRNRA